MKRYILILQCKINTGSGDQNAVCGARMAEACRRSKRHRNGFVGFGVNSEYQ